jgi:hypothetical protein
MKYFLYFFLASLPLATSADECLLRDQFMTEQASSISHIIKHSLCEITPSISNQTELDRVIKTMFYNQKLELANISQDRHKVAEHLNDCSPEKDSKALVINFAGTGSFNPRSFDVMTEFMACFAEKKLDKSLSKNVFQTIATIQQKTQPSQYKWGGIEAGPINQFFSDPYLKKNAKYLDFATFASEESELIADPNKLSWTEFKKIPNEMNRSSAGIPKGIASAMICVNKYLAAAKKLSIKPKIIILSHSSGGRSAVKFAENLKWLVNPLTNKRDHKIDLVFSMDPVKEAHEAMKEVSSQYAGRLVDRAADYIPFVETEDKPINVWTRDQPQSLYKPSNTSRWVNVYQNKDTEGLKGPIKFGIHGSSIANADYNKFITKGIGSDGHGAITYHDETTKLFISEMKKQLGD